MCLSGGPDVWPVTGHHSVDAALSWSPLCGHCSLSRLFLAHSFWLSHTFRLALHSVVGAALLGPTLQINQSIKFIFV